MTAKPPKPGLTSASAVIAKLTWLLDGGAGTQSVDDVPAGQDQRTSRGHDT
jgi:hypothetical protein